MIKIENTNVVGFEDAIRGMRNPMNSWEKSDSVPGYAENNNKFEIGPNDHELMMKLSKAGSVHAKFRRMIVVYVDLTAPLYWWKEFDTYIKFEDADSPLNVLEHIICALNNNREAYLVTKDKRFWWQMIQLLPSSYNQRRTIMLNYEVLVGIYHDRKDHKLDEWHDLCNWISTLPYSELITGDEPCK